MVFIFFKFFIKFVNHLHYIFFKQLWILDQCLWSNFLQWRFLHNFDYSWRLSWRFTNWLRFMNSVCAVGYMALGCQRSEFPGAVGTRHSVIWRWWDGWGHFIKLLFCGPVTLSYLDLAWNSNCLLEGTRWLTPPCLVLTWWFCRFLNNLLSRFLSTINFVVEYLTRLNQGLTKLARERIFLFGCAESKLFWRVFSTVSHKIYFQGLTTFYGSFDKWSLRLANRLLNLLNTGRTTLKRNSHLEGFTRFARLLVNLERIR